MLWDSLEDQPKFPEPIFSLRIQASFLPNQFSLFLKGFGSTSDPALNLFTRPCAWRNIQIFHTSV